MNGGATLDGDGAWSLLLAVRRARGGEPPAAPATVAWDGMGRWTARETVSEAARDFLDLYLPFATAGPSRPMTVGQLGQSLDGRIATEGGESHYINGPQAIDHLHRMRALADAVVVGAETIARDDPRLTARRVEGEQPVRVIIDPRRRLGSEHRVFRDSAAPTVVVTAQGCAPSPDGDVIALQASDGILPVADMVARLRDRGLNALFVEGGGTTVSRFLAAGCLDRFQVAVAPMIIGSGRPGIVLPPIDRLAEALRPAVRRFPMGADMLFECLLKS